MKIYKNLTSEQITNIQRIINYAEFQITKGRKVCGQVMSLPQDEIERIWILAENHAQQIIDKGFVGR